MVEIGPTPQEFNVFLGIELGVSWHVHELWEMSGIYMGLSRGLSMGTILQSSLPKYGPGLEPMFNIDTLNPSSDFGFIRALVI